MATMAPSAPLSNELWSVVSISVTTAVCLVGLFLLLAAIALSGIFVAAAAIRATLDALSAPETRVARAAARASDSKVLGGFATIILFIVSVLVEAARVPYRYDPNTHVYVPLVPDPPPALKVAATLLVRAALETTLVTLALSGIWIVGLNLCLRFVGGSTPRPKASKS